MNISRNVIRDLLPAYVAGEASADTRALLETALAADAELRAEATVIGTVPGSDVAPPAALGLDALKRTQRLLRRRALLAGFSIFFSTLPLAMVDRPWGIAGRLGETACLLVAAAGWVLFLKNAALLHAAGLDGPRSSRATMAWYFATAIFAFSVMFVVQDWTAMDLGNWTILIVMLFWTPVLWIGRRLGQVWDPLEIPVVQSLETLTRDSDESV